MSSSSKSQSALVLLDTTKVAAPAVKKFGGTVAKTFLDIAKTEKMNAARAILIGLALPILKNSMARGEFRPWLETNVTSGNNWTKATAIKNASYFTRLAVRFVETAKPTGDQVLAITNGKAVQGKAGKDADAGALIKAIEEFVGEKSITELLEEHGIKNGGASGGGSSLPALPADDNTLLQDIAEAMLSLRKTVTDPDTLKRLTASQIGQLKKQLDDTQEDFRKALEALAAK